MFHSSQDLDSHLEVMSINFGPYRKEVVMYILEFLGHCKANTERAERNKYIGLKEHLNLINKCLVFLSLHTTIS